MLLQDVLLPEFIKVDIEAEDKEKAFEELVTHYCKANGSNDYKDILSAIVKREEKMSTGIHKGVAVPHGKTNTVKTVRGVLGISQKGVDYDALDGEPVYLLFMFISPLEDSEEYLRMLKHLAKLIEVPQFKSELRSQKDSNEAFNVICKFEEMLSLQN
jgi:PTS system fructose-specific IIC component/PTS system nitrogen regulatory IIA component